MHFREAFAERAQRVRQQGDMRHARQACRDRAPGSALHLCDLFTCAPQFALRGLGTAHETFSGRRHGHPPGLALEQRGAEVTFQFANAAGQRRLGDVEVSRGRAQRAVLGDREHVAQMVKFH